MKNKLFLTLLISTAALADNNLIGSWSSKTGTLCESTGEVKQRWESLAFENNQDYRQAYSYGFPGHICRSEFRGSFKSNNNSINFELSNGSSGCNGETQLIQIASRNGFYEIFGNTLKVTIPNQSCKNLITIYKKVK